MTWLDIAWVVLNRHQQKRPVQAHQPEVYLEPKWLRCKERFMAGAKIQRLDYSTALRQCDL